MATSESDKNQKNLSQIEKKLTQIDKKRLALKRTHDNCLNKLRSGVHLGQDRYMRHYWSLVNAGGIYVESCQLARPGSFYFSEDSHLLLENSNQNRIESNANANEAENADKIISNLLDDLISKVELNQVDELAESEEQVLRKYSGLIERLSDDDPFRFTLKTNHPDVNNLSFRQIEILIQNEIQLKTPQKISLKYLNPNESGNDKWWLCSSANMLKCLMDCLCKRGYREKALIKSLNKLNEENYNSTTESSMPISLDNQMGQDSTFYQNRYLNSAGKFLKI